MMLKCNDLQKKYKDKTVVDQVNLELEEGRIYALLGQNGSGKTTLMKMIAGLVKADHGDIIFCGNTMGVKCKAEVAYMPTEVYYYDYMKVEDVGRYYQVFFKDFRRNRFDDLVFRMGLSLKDKVKHLSSGQITKLKLAATLARDAKLYLLDEPLNGIDLLSKDLIITTILEIAGEENTIVISSHLVDEIEKIIDHVILLDKGKIRLIDDAEKIREVNGKSIVDVYKEVLA